MVERLFFAVPQGCLRFVIVVFPDHTYLLFLLGGISHFIRTFCKETVETLIRKRFLRHLVRVCIIWLCPIKRTLGLYGLNRDWRDNKTTFDMYIFY